MPLCYTVNVFMTDTGKRSNITLFMEQCAQSLRVCDPFTLVCFQMQTPVDVTE